MKGIFVKQGRLQFRVGRLEKVRAFSRRNVFRHDEHEAIADARTRGACISIVPRKCATTEEWLAQLPEHIKSHAGV